MSGVFDSAVTDLMSDALRQALARLETLGLVDDVCRAAATRSLTKLILEAAAAGERNAENLILFAIGRFQVH